MPVRLFARPGDNAFFDTVIEESFGNYADVQSALSITTHLRPTLSFFFPLLHNSIYRSQVAPIAQVAALEEGTDIEMDGSEHVLVVDDDPEIRDVVFEYLTDEGFEVSVAADGKSMTEVLDQKPVDLVILDVRLPGEDGLTLAAKLRQRSQTGIIMLSRKDDLVDRVAGLEVGADDYVAKPFHLRELLARVRSVLRRRPCGPAPARTGNTKKSRSRYRFAGYELERDKRSLLAPNGNPVELSAGEFDLLLTFLEHPQRAISRDQILDDAQERGVTLFDRSIDVRVGRLRRKIEANPHRPEMIKTVRGIGYMFDIEVQQQ